MAKVFISYARSDYKDASGKELPNNVITKVKDALKAENISYWIDESLSAGEDWAQLIPPAILDCEVFVFISSKNSNDAHFTKSEVAIAHEYEKHIIPLRIDDTKYNPSIVVHLAGLEHISYYLNPENELKRLIVAIKTYLNELENKAKAEQQEIERQKKIKEIDSELKAQYDKKLSLENVISEQQSALSEVESQRDDVLKTIKNLEENKESLSSKSKSTNGHLSNSLSQVSHPHSTVITNSGDIWKSFKNAKWKTKFTICFIVLIIALVVIIPYCKWINATKTINLQNQGFVNISKIASSISANSDIYFWGNIDNSSWYTSGMTQDFDVSFAKGDTLVMECTLNVASQKSKSNQTDKYDNMDRDQKCTPNVAEREPKSSYTKKYDYRDYNTSNYFHCNGYVTLNIDNLSFDSRTESMIDHKVSYVFEKSGTSKLTWHYEHYNNYDIRGKYVRIYIKSSKIGNIIDLCKRGIK